MILPQLEQKAAFDAINFSYEYSPYGNGDTRGVPVNSTVAEVVIGVYVCPTEGVNYWGTYGSYGAGHSSAQVPCSNYMANAGVTIRPGCIYAGCNRCSVANAVEGAMYEYGAVRINEFRDGLSNTLLLGETAGYSGNWFVASSEEVQRVSRRRSQSPVAESARVVLPRSQGLQRACVRPPTIHRLRVASSWWCQLRVRRRLGEVPQEHH